MTRHKALLVAAILSLLSVTPQTAPQSQRDPLSANIDTRVSPRDDFFQFAAGEWLRRNPIPENRARWTVANLSSEEGYLEVRQLSERAAAAPGPRGSAAQLIGDVWATGMDAATINADGLKRLQPDLDRIGAIASLGDLADVLAVLHRRRMLWDNYFTFQDVVFGGGVGVDDRDSNRRIFGLRGGGHTLGRPAYTATNPQRVAIRDGFREYLFKTFVRLRASEESARASANAVFDLEARLAAAVAPDDTSRTITVAELARLAPAIDWSRYFRRLGVAKIDSVRVQQPKFFQALDETLRATPINVWKDYLRFWLIKMNAPFLDDGTFGEFFAFKRLHTEDPELLPRWRLVAWQATYWLGLPLDALYGQSNWPASLVARYQSVGEALRKAFQARIEQADWLDARTKEQALRKVARLRLAIGPAKSSIDYSTMPLHRDSYVLNMIRSAEWFHDLEISRLDKPVSGNAFDLHPTAGGGDAEYVPTLNEVRIANPSMFPGFRVEELDDAVVYAGVALGHEVAHSLDDTARFFDAAGNKIDWWTPQAAAAFEARAKQVIPRLDAFAVRQGLPSGQKALGEAMADLVGLRLQLDAFKGTETFKRNERVAGFAPLQRFFLAYVQRRASHERDETLSGRIRARLNALVANMPEFHEAFGVKEGDRMYLPESDRARIW